MNRLHRDILVQTRKLIRLHSLLGLNTYPKTKSLEQFLAQDPRAGNQVSRSSSNVNTLQPKPRKPSKTRKTCRISRNQASQALEELHRKIEFCSSCHLHAQGLGKVIGMGKPGIRLLVVGDWTRPETKSSEPKASAQLSAQLFGPGEDEMLWKMMQAIDLTPEDVYLTNCIKCRPRTDSIPNADHEQTCFPYLLEEITVLQPMLICSMGTRPTRLLLGKTAPLIRLRGRFHRCKRGEMRDIPIIPTFHPRFLLSHPEMKRAVWLDLQMIRQYLQKQ